MEIKTKSGDVIHTVAGDTLRGADLRGADLGGADLKDADLRDAFIITGWRMVRDDG